MALFRPGGQKPEINSKLSEVVKLQTELKVLQAEAEKYWAYDEEFMALEEEMAHVDERKKLCSRHLHRIQNLQKAWPEWIRLSAVRNELSVLLPRVDEFPTQGKEKFEKLKERQQNQALKVKQHREEWESLQRQLEALLIQNDLLVSSVALDETWDKLALYQSNGKRLQELNHKIASLENELTVKLAQAGAEWTLQRALAFKDDVATRTEKQEAVRELNERKQEVKRSVIELERAEQSAEKANTVFLQRQKEVEQQWSEIPSTEELLDRHQSALTQLRTLLLEESQLQQNLQRAVEEAKECAEQLRGLQEQVTSPQAPRKSNTLFLYLSILILLIALAAAALLRENLPAMGATLVFGVIGALLCWLLGRQAGGTDVSGADFFTEQTQRLNNKKISLEAETVRLQEALSKIQNDIAAAGKLLGLSSNDSAACDAYGERLKEQREARRQYDRAMADLDNTKFQAERARELAKNFQDEWQYGNSLLEAATKRWQNWLHRQGLPESLSQEAAEATIEQIRKVCELAKSSEEESHAADDLRIQLEAFEVKCHALFAALNKPVPEQPDLERELRELRIQRDAAVEDQKQRILLEERLNINEQATPVIREDGRKLMQEFNDLLAAGGAGDENEFLKRVFSWHKRQELELAEKSLLEKLQMLSAPGHALEKLQAELATIDHATLTSRLFEIEAESTQANAEFDRLNQRLGELQEARRRLASDEEVGQCAQKLEQAKTELQELAAQWAVRRLAFRLMEKARHKFETERQPAVMQSASESLKIMSRGRYEGIMRPLGSSESHLLQPNGDLRGNEKIWNTALKEKVYLSLRFGLIETYNARLEPLPVILDDALVNLDPHNMRGAAQAILRLAEQQQVIYLTCHPHTVEHFAAHDETLRVYEIDGQGRFNLKLHSN